MHTPEVVWGIGILILLCLLIFGVTVAGRRRRNAQADAIARQNLEKTTPKIDNPEEL